MSFTRLSLSLAGVIGALAATLAGAAVWLLVTQPVRGANALSDAATKGDVSPLLKAVAGVLYDALQGILKYL
jgi:hypothetical protein